MSIYSISFFLYMCFVISLENGHCAGQGDDSEKKPKLTGSRSSKGKEKVDIDDILISTRKLTLNEKQPDFNVNYGANQGIIEQPNNFLKEDYVFGVGKIATVSEVKEDGNLYIAWADARSIDQYDVVVALKEESLDAEPYPGYYVNFNPPGDKFYVRVIPHDHIDGAYQVAFD